MMIHSGIRFDDAIRHLQMVYPNKDAFEDMLTRLYKGESEVSVVRSLFPWWIAYPFTNISLVINISIFLDNYNQYFQIKRQWITTLYNLLLYPFFLLLFSICILVMAQQFMGSFGFRSSDFIDQYGVVIVAVVLLCQMSWFFWIIWMVVRFNIMDFFEVLDICFKMNWPLYIILNELKFNGHFHKLWQRIVVDTIEYCSFFEAIFIHLNLPDVIKVSMHSYAFSDRLSSGISSSKELYRAYFFRYIKYHVRCLQVSIYCVVIILIFFIMVILYSPLKSINTL